MERLSESRTTRRPLTVGLLTSTMLLAGFAGLIAAPTGAATTIYASCGHGPAIAGVLNSYCATEYTQPSPSLGYQVVVTGPFTGAISVHFNAVVGSFHFVATCYFAVVTGQQVSQSNCYNWHGIYGQQAVGMRIKLEGKAETYQPLSEGCVTEILFCGGPDHLPTIGYWEVRAVG